MEQHKGEGSRTHNVSYAEHNTERKKTSASAGQHVAALLITQNQNLREAQRDRGWIWGERERHKKDYKWKGGRRN